MTNQNKNPLNSSLKNILIASSSPPDRGSGIGNYAKELSEAFAAMGFTIHYLSPPPEDHTWLDANNITHVSSDQFDDPIQRCSELIAYFKDNSIHAAINNDNPFLQSIAPALDCPLVVIGHMDRKSVATLACYGWQWVDYIVAISYDMHRRFVDKYGVPVNRCPVIYNGVKNRLPDIRTIIANNTLQVIYSGGYSRNKGGHKILQAIEVAPELWDTIRLQWFGGCKPEIRKKLSAYPNVTVHGRVPRNDFIKALAASDVLLLPSKYEGCPMVLLEAMNFGVVPISSDGHGAMRWIVQNGISGFICDLAKWARHVNRCLTVLRDNQKLLMQMKLYSRQRFEASLDITITAQRIVRLIETPTVQRTEETRTVDVLRWHRPLLKDGMKAPFIDRLCIHLGMLRKAGKLMIEREGA